MKVAYSAVVMVKKQLGELRELGRRVKAVNSTAPDPILAKKLANITKNS